MKEERRLTLYRWQQSDENTQVQISTPLLEKGRMTPRTES